MLSCAIFLTYSLPSTSHFILSHPPSYSMLSTSLLALHRFHWKIGKNLPFSTLPQLKRLLREGTTKRPLVLNKLQLPLTFFFYHILEGAPFTRLFFPFFLSTVPKPFLLLTDRRKKKRKSRGAEVPTQRRTSLTTSQSPLPRDLRRSKVNTCFSDSTCRESEEREKRSGVGKGKGERGNRPGGKEASGERLQRE